MVAEAHTNAYVSINSKNHEEKTEATDHSYQYEPEFQI